MVISKFPINLYAILLILSIVIGIIYIFISMLRDKYINKNILYLYFMLLVVCILFFGKFFTIMASGFKLDVISAGFSSYGGFIGVILSALIMDKIIPNQKKILKYSIISLPLTYSIGKLGCFLAGCCYGIPYNGILSVTYTEGINIPLFPIQLTESIVFLIIFLICNHYKKNNKIIYLTLIVCALSKYLLDYLRYEHINTIISINQIFSILIIITTIIVYYFNKKRYNNKGGIKYV